MSEEIVCAPFWTQLKNVHAQECVPEELPTDGIWFASSGTYIEGEEYPFVVPDGVVFTPANFPDFTQPKDLIFNTTTSTGPEPVECVYVFENATYIDSGRGGDGSPSYQNVYYGNSADGAFISAQISVTVGGFIGSLLVSAQPPQTPS